LLDKKKLSVALARVFSLFWDNHDDQNPKFGMPWLRKLGLWLDCPQQSAAYASFRMSFCGGIASRVAIVCTLAFPAWAGDGPTSHTDRPSAHLALPVYRVEAGLGGEIFPFLANYTSLQRSSDRRLGVVAVTLSNTTGESIQQRVRVVIPGWSDPEIQLVSMPAGAERTFFFAPSFLPRLYQSREIIAATALISVTDDQGSELYSTTTPVRLRSSEDMYWGEGFKFASFIASWVTPHSREVEMALSRARHYIPDRRLPGYEEWKNAREQEQETYREARAIFTALHSAGLSYVKSSLTLGGNQALSERVRMPSVSLLESSANCIDAVVLYASLFENLSMDAKVVIVPGHAYVGVRVAPGSPRFLMIDAALTGHASFEAAVASANRGLARRPASQITQVLIPEARSSGIYPMP
jgi:hypothetical protein